MCIKPPWALDAADTCDGTDALSRIMRILVDTIGRERQHIANDERLMGWITVTRMYMDIHVVRENWCYRAFDTINSTYKLLHLIYTWRDIDFGEKYDVVATKRFFTICVRFKFLYVRRVIIIRAFSIAVAFSRSLYILLLQSDKTASELYGGRGSSLMFARYADAGKGSLAEIEYRPCVPADRKWWRIESRFQRKH